MNLVIKLLNSDVNRFAQLLLYLNINLQMTTAAFFLMLYKWGEEEEYCVFCTQIKKLILFLGKSCQVFPFPQTNN